MQAWAVVEKGAPLVHIEKPTSETTGTEVLRQAGQHVVPLSCTLHDVRAIGLQAGAGLNETKLITGTRMKMPARSAYAT